MVGGAPTFSSIPTLFMVPGGCRRVVGNCGGIPVRRSDFREKSGVRALRHRSIWRGVVRTAPCRRRLAEKHGGPAFELDAWRRTPRTADDRTVGLVTALLSLGGPVETADRRDQSRDIELLTFDVDRKAELPHRFRGDGPNRRGLAGGGQRNP
jgi:hypothetical protein